MPKRLSRRMKLIYIPRQRCLSGTNIDQNYNRRLCTTNVALKLTQYLKAYLIIITAPPSKLLPSV